MNDCKNCVHYERCTVVHCFEYDKYKNQVCLSLEEHWLNNPDDIAVNKYPTIEVKMTKCHAFRHIRPDIYIEYLSDTSKRISL